MRLVSHLVAGLAFSFLGTSAHAFDLNDCIIKGMKGVGSDLAAAQVRYACNQKRLEARKVRLAALYKEYGEALDIESIEQASNFGTEQTGLHFLQVKNKSRDTVVTLLRLEVVPVSDNPYAKYVPGYTGPSCDQSKSRKFAYSVTLKAFETLKLVYPSTAQSECLSIVSALGRAASWKDVSFSSSAKPDDRDPFADIE
jgi:hypothetical protein